MKQLIIEKNSGQIIEVFSETSIIIENEHDFTDGNITISKINYRTMTAIDLELITFDEGDEFLEKYNYAIKDGKVVVFDAIAYKLNLIRTERNKLLQESDWTQVNDVPFTNEQNDEWRQYRQSLRDFPLYCDINNPIYPSKPISKYKY